MVLPFFLLAAGRDATAASQDRPRQPLGSLSVVGNVYVNESPAPPESTIFTGDTLRTGDDGTAIFTMNGKGAALKVAPLAQVEFVGDPRFTAVLKAGAAVVDSIGGPAGVTLRAGDFVVVPTVFNRVTAAKVERQADGSFLISCSNGDVGAIPLQGTSGRFLQAGQSVTISAVGSLLAGKGSPTKPTDSHVKRPVLDMKEWSLLGLGGVAAGVGLLLANHAKQSVSPSTP